MRNFDDWIQFSVFSQWVLKTFKITSFFICDTKSNLIKNCLILFTKHSTSKLSAKTTETQFFIFQSLWNQIKRVFKRIYLISFIKTYINIIWLYKICQLFYQKIKRLMNFNKSKDGSNIKELFKQLIFNMLILITQICSSCMPKERIVKVWTLYFKFITVF